MRSILKYAVAAILPAMFITLAAQAGTTIWGSTHRSVAAANRIPVDTGSSSSPGYNSVSDVLDAMSGDCTSTAAAVTCTKTSGTAFTALATTAPGTGVATALGINIGSAGAPVLFNGALGTPSSGVATNFTGTATALNIGGNAATATSATTSTTATSATNTAITDDTTTNATMYPTWVTASTGNLPQKTASTKLTFNPSTGMLSSTGFTGALTGNASTVTNGVYTTDTGSVTAAMIVSAPALAGTNFTGTGASFTAGHVTNGIYTTDTGTVTNTMLAGSVALTKLATQATNTVVGNATSGSAAPTALAVGTCSTAGSALNWTTNTGFGCNTSITAAAVPASGITGTTLASNVVTSSLTSVGTLTGGATGAGFTVALASSTITGTLPAANNETNLRHTSIGATFNGGGSAITANSKQWVYVPYGTTIQSATIACDVSGSIVFDVQMDTYSNFSTSMTSIVASAPPTVTSAQKSQDATLTGWTVSIPAGDYILFKVTSATTVTNCNIVLDTIRT